MTSEPKAWVRLGPALAVLTTLAVGGCHHEEKSTYRSASKPPTVEVSRPQFRTIVRVVGQPSFIEAYERTSIYPKLSAYIEKWVVDIGDKVNKGDVLARLFVPELVEEYNTKKAVVGLDKEKIELARKMVDVAEADVKAAEARLDESRSMLGKYQSEVDRWETEVARMSIQVQRGVVDPQVLLESKNQLRSSGSSRDAANATIKKAEAEVLSYRASLAKSRVDVSVARADLAVADSEEKKMKAWVGYLTLTAPFEGVIVARNANTSDFVLPSSGDPTADRRSPDLSPSGSAAPIYVVDRTDIVRIFVDIPEQEANYVRIGSKASVQVKAYREAPIEGTVTRTAWALNVKSRTLRAEIDLTNPLGELLPGMYAYASVTIERPYVPAVPLSSLAHAGDKTYCWVYEGGKAKRVEVRTGVSDDEWIELSGIHSSSPADMKNPWKPIGGNERIIFGDISALDDGQRVVEAE